MPRWQDSPLIRSLTLKNDIPRSVSYFPLPPHVSYWPEGNGNLLNAKPPIPSTYEPPAVQIDKYSVARDITCQHPSSPFFALPPVTLALHPDIAEQKTKSEAKQQQASILVGPSPISQPPILTAASLHSLTTRVTRSSPIDRLRFQAPPPLFSRPPIARKSTTIHSMISNLQSSTTLENTKAHGLRAACELLT